MDDTPVKELDEIDREILRMLSKNPRIPYKELSSKLEESGYEMTGEGVRYRVSKLLDATSPFFLLLPAEFGWEVLRICIVVENMKNAVDEVNEAVCESDAWLVTKGFGDFDIWAIMIAKNNRDIQNFLTNIKSIEYVDQVHHFVETERQTYMKDYLTLD
jgi:DNA-binding Lrp family transcriptional regulator